MREMETSMRDLEMPMRNMEVYYEIFGIQMRGIWKSMRYLEKHTFIL